MGGRGLVVVDRDRRFGAWGVMGFSVFETDRPGRFALSPIVLEPMARPWTPAQHTFAKKNLL